MSKNERMVGISRRTLVKSTAIGSLALAAGGFSLPFTLRSAAAAVQQAREKVVWGACSVNCGSRCALRLHVKDNEVTWVETDNTGSDEYGNHQVRACLRGRSIRRRINHPDRLNYPMKRVGKRGEGKFERISWDEALDTIASNTLINQHGDINHTHEVLQDDSKCEMIVGIDHFMTASAKYCDILLPDLMPTEQEDLISHESAGNMGYVILAQPATSAKFERKPIYWMLSEVAKRLGPDVYQTFTEGRSQHEWIKYLHAKTKERNPEMPDYEEMKTTGIFKKKCPEEHYVAFRAFREDPQANPLKTPSGKIEIYSERLAKIADTWELKKDEIIHPLPAYTPGFDGWDDPLRKTYPLQLTGFHYKARTHSSYGNIDVLQQACPQEVWINPIDAQARGIRHGDTVRVFNNNGEMLIAAKVTPRILPGVTAIGQGAWLKADMFGDRVDHGGSINILTSHRPSPLAKGNPSHSNLVQIEKV
ncbi:molybdopterin-dependent oxidoreductase [Escherichia coli]|nr:molybdopterin-dependent oxidoreductase [Escherichia coli]